MPNIERSTVLELYTERIWGHSQPVIGATLFQTIAYSQICPKSTAEKKFAHAVFCLCVCVSTTRGACERKVHQVDALRGTAAERKARPLCKKHKTGDLHAVLHHWLQTESVGDSASGRMGVVFSLSLHRRLIYMRRLQLFAAFLPVCESFPGWFGQA